MTEVQAAELIRALNQAAQPLWLIAVMLLIQVALLTLFIRGLMGLEK